MRRFTSLLISTILALALLLVGVGCSRSQSTASGNEASLSSETELLSDGETARTDEIVADALTDSDGEAAANAASADSDKSAAYTAASPADEAATTNVPTSDNTDPSNITASDKVADASDMADVVEVVDHGMVPIHADDLLDGIYPVVMRSSSSMFKADHVCLEVKDGHMQAYLFMTSQSYLYMFPGTALDAASADEKQYISLEKTSIEGEDLEAFLLPVDALDDGLPFSSYSRRKEKWYDRTLLFEAGSLPVEAFRNPPYKQVAELNLTDGEYVVDVKLDGGSGRASISNPARLTISGGKATAHIVWSSPNYDFMMVDDVKYTPVSDDSGNSAFDIPVAFFDYKIPVQADTTAMSQPHLIDYGLTFDSSSISKAN